MIIMLPFAGQCQSMEAMSQEVDPRRQPFPSLRQCFEQIDEVAGFNIEIKYPMLMEVLVVTSVIAQWAISESTPV